MMDTVAKHRYLEALRHFEQARWRAGLEQVMARLSGESVDLLSFEEVQGLLRTRQTGKRVLEDIPLDAIVGSVGRYTDFTRSFLPRSDSHKVRWANVQMQMTDLEGLPPIEVYRVGEAYFVIDGNHRVSVARQLEATHIQAYVTEVETKVPLKPEDKPDDLILKAEQVDFLERTRLDERRPEADLRVTEPGRYREILEAIEVHRYLLELERGGEVAFEDAALHWFDEVYYPVSVLIREMGLLTAFPNRTRLDLYAWIVRHRRALRESLEWDVGMAAAATDIAARYGSSRQSVMARVGEGMLEAVVPDSLESGPPSGTWREGRIAGFEAGRLFGNIFVPISGHEVGWYALSQGLEIARREGGQVLGLHVVADRAARESEAVAAIRSQFYRRCRQAGVPGQMAVAVGEVARIIADRARLADLTVLRLAYPPPPSPIARLGHGFRTILRRINGPLLVVPRAEHSLQRLLLAYNGSVKAREALFVAAYLAGRWQAPLTVVTVADNGTRSEAVLQQATQYLQGQRVAVEAVLERGPAVETILATAAGAGSDLVVMGGYSTGVVHELVAGSTLDQMLRSSRLPLLICR